MPEVKSLNPFFELDQSATYLLLISPERIPHLALVSQGKYYSLTHKRAFIGEDFLPFFKFLKRDKRKMIFIELDDLKLSPKTTFAGFEKARNNGDTCLYPIRNFVLPESNANFVYELIPELYLFGKIRESFHLNMENDLNESGDFNLSIYSKEAIFSYIESLNEKYAKRS